MGVLQVTAVFYRFWTPSWAPKIVIFEENRVQEASGSPSEDVFQEKSKKRQQKELKKKIFGACARKDTYNACVSRSIIYSVSWLSDVCCDVDTCILPEVHVGPSWRPKVEAKTTPSGLQDGLKTDPEAICRGFEVGTFKRPIRQGSPIRVSNLTPPHLGLWEEGTEGKPSSHTVTLYKCIM